MADVVVDATGDADVAARAGATFWQAGGDDPTRIGEQLMYRIELPDDRPDELENLACCDFGRTVVVWGPGVREAADATDADSLSRGEVDCRLRVYEDFEQKRQKCPDLSGGRVAETPPLLGIRQSRFIEGECQLTADDVLSGRRFDDGVAMCVNCILHYYGYRRYLENGPYDIPYRCLVPRGIGNLLAAGRCISCDQVAYESIRGMVIMMALGQAAGTAAALSVQDGVTPRGLSVRRLQDTLLAQGAVVRKGEETNR
jgi:hypothetical protein